MTNLCINSFITRCLTIVIAAVFMASCQQDEEKIEPLYKVYIDNPTENKYTVFINGQKNIVKPNSYEMFELEQGDYHFKAFDNKNKEIFEEEIKVDTTVLLNIANQEYMIVGEIYSDNPQIYKEIVLDTVYYGGQKIIGLIKTLPKENNYYKQNWDYNLQEVMPEMRPIHKEYKIYTKIIREKDLLQYYYN